MSYRGLRMVLAALLASMASVGSAADAFVVRFNTGVGGDTAPCNSFYWQDELIFHNAGTARATIRLLGVSNGQVSNPLPLLLDPGSTRSSLGPEFPNWVPDSRPVLWAAHLEVPDAVVMTSRALVRRFTPCPCERFHGCVTTYAGLTLPVNRSLVPPGVPSYHLGADVGGHEPLADAISTHINVTILNAGEVTASASIEVRNANDDTVLGRLSDAVPANTVTQVRVAVYRSEGPIVLAWERYVVVTVDQPSLSFATSLADDRDPFFSASVAP